MAEASIQSRLRQHERAFDGLLSLIPAKLYYGNGDEPSEQWLRKKQTKSEKSAARRANLDPENELNKSVKEVMAERSANKRKLEQISGAQTNKGKDDDDDDDDDEEEEQEEEEQETEEGDESIDGVSKETPGEGLKRAKENASKKQKTKKDETTKDGGDSEEEEEDDDDDDLGVSLEEANLSQKQQKKLLKKHAKAEKRAEKRKNKTQQKTGEDANGENDIETEADAKTKAKKEKKDNKKKKPEPPAVESAVKDNDMDVDDDDDDDDDNETANGGLVSGVGFSGLLSDQDVPSAPSSPSTKSDTLDTPLSTNPLPNSNSAATPITSIASVTIPSTFSDSLTKPPSPTSSVASSSSKLKVTVPKDTSALRARLAARIAELRAARKADVDEVDSSGNVIRTRQQLIEDRRQKQAERKVHKKELRRAARLEEDRKREEAVASARGSPLVRVGGDDGAAAEVADIKTSFSFGRVAFQDGAQLSHDWSYVKDGASAHKKRSGPASNDVKAQLARLESQKKRLAKMDEAQRKDIEEKERWLAARKRAEGVGRGDGASLTATAAAAGALSMADGTMKSAEQMLKKAIKRKDKVKKKSEKEWSDRKEGVQKSIQDRQRKREENLRKRKEDKMLRRAGLAKKAKKGTGAGGGSKGKGRPGFEGSFGGRKK